jgi:hypothetical protein
VIAAVEPSRGQHLDGDVPSELGIVGAVHLALAAASDEGVDAMNPEPCTDREPLRRVVAVDHSIDRLRDRESPRL